MNKLYQHQEDGIAFLNEHCGGYLAYDMGTGKTRIIIEWFKPLAAKGAKLLVVCPLTLIKSAWADDIEKFSDLTMCNLHGKERFEADIYVVNYEAFTSVKRMAEIDALLDKYNFACCLDEASIIGNARAKTTKNILARRGKFRVRVAMSGTPACQSDEMWWSQISFVKVGVVSENIFGFKNRYFELRRGSACMPLAGLDKSTYRHLFSRGWKVASTGHKRDSLYRQLKSIVLFRRLSDCIDLPPEVDELRTVDMIPEQAKCYREMKDELITEIENEEIVAQVALVKLMKLRQITSGFAINLDGEAVSFNKNPKLDELERTLNEIEGQAIIFFNFKKEARDIKERFGESVVIIDGDTKEKADRIKEFKRGDYKYLAANIQSMAHGVTLVNSRYCIYYSHSYSLEDYLQSRARIRRIGQSNTCVYIHIMCRDSIDRIIHDVLVKKGEATEILERMLK